jgi:hypothetical protein
MRKPKFNLIYTKKFIKSNHSSEIKESVTTKFALPLQNIFHTERIEIFLSLLSSQNINVSLTFLP